MPGRSIPFCKGKVKKKQGLICNVQFSRCNFQLRISNRKSNIVIDIIYSKFVF